MRYQIKGPQVSSGRSDESPRVHPEAGFTVIEIILAMVVLSIGLLGTAGTTLLLIKQTTMADVATDRAVALQGTIEGLRSIPFDSVTSGSDSIGAYEGSACCLGPVYFLLTSVFNQRLVCALKANPLFAQNAATAIIRLAARPK